MSHSVSGTSLRCGGSRGNSVGTYPESESKGSVGREDRERREGRKQNEQREFDGIHHSQLNNVLILVSDLYELRISSLSIHV